VGQRTDRGSTCGEEVAGPWEFLTVERVVVPTARGPPSPADHNSTNPPTQTQWREGSLAVLSTQTEFIVSRFVLLATALLAGEVAMRRGQVALVGHLLTGVILGP
jgi:hypothetical protein